MQRDINHPVLIIQNDYYTVSYLQMYFELMIRNFIRTEYTY